MYYKCLIFYLCPTVVAATKSGAGIMCHSVCQIIYQLETAPNTEGRMQAA